MGSLVWDLGFGIFGLGSGFGIFGLGSLVWDLWFGIFGLGSLVLDLWFGIFVLGSLVWGSEAGGTRLLRLGELLESFPGNPAGPPIVPAL